MERPTVLVIFDSFVTSSNKLQSIGWKTEQEYESLKNSFGELIQCTCKAIEDRGIDVNSVVDAIRDLPIARGEQDKAYFMEFLRGSMTVKSLFNRLGCNWDYLHPEIYQPLIKTLSLDVEQVADDYLAQWAAFLDQIPLSAFCKFTDIELDKDSDPPSGFVEVVMKINWGLQPKYLRDVDELRRMFARKCSLQSYAVTIANLTFN